MGKQVAWIVAGFGQNGGNYTNNTIAKILEEDYDYEPVMVFDKKNRHRTKSVLPIELTYRSVDIKYMFGMVHKDDIILSNPSHSEYFIGLRTPCTSIMYAQGFSTFSVLDGFFNHYVAVSSFMKKYLKSIYQIEAEVIPAFIDPNNFPEPKNFEDKEDKILVYQKFFGGQFQPLFNNISRNLKKRNIEYKILDLQEKIPQEELHATINNYKYIMNLSIAEGFGLVPLEAMYMGTIPCGFDGFGGRHYMQMDKNSINVPYPKIVHLVNKIEMYHKEPIKALSLSAGAKETAKQYSKEKFIQSWKGYLASILKK